MDTPDEIREMRFRERNPDLFPKIETDLCDVCLCQKEDCRRSPDKGGYVCPSCLLNGNAKKYYLENDISEEQFNAFIQSLKL